MIFHEILLLLLRHICIFVFLNVIVFIRWNFSGVLNARSAPRSIEWLLLKWLASALGTHITTWNLLFIVILNLTHNVISSDINISIRTPGINVSTLILRLLLTRCSLWKWSLNFIWCLWSQLRSLWWLILFQRRRLEMLQLRTLHIRIALRTGQPLYRFRKMLLADSWNCLVHLSVRLFLFECNIGGSRVESCSILERLYGCFVENPRIICVSWHRSIRNR